ncbi:MAG: discoidin domain-containing protein [Candidatus Latescibacterota bacterium]|nr:MAG: discoidin domain-containing protein [Candidatus Latescibacterota bacterium]
MKKLNSEAVSVIAFIAFALLLVSIFAGALILAGKKASGLAPPPELQTAKKRYNAELAKLAADYRAKLVALAKKHEKVATKYIKVETKRGELEDALAWKAWREELLAIVSPGLRITGTEPEGLEKAFDGRLETFWTPPVVEAKQWIGVDLGRAQVLSRVSWVYPASKRGRPKVVHLTLTDGKHRRVLEVQRAGEERPIVTDSRGKVRGAFVTNLGSLRRTTIEFSPAVVSHWQWKCLDTYGGSPKIFELEASK